MYLQWNIVRDIHLGAWKLEPLGITNRTFTAEVSALNTVCGFGGIFKLLSTDCDVEKILW